MFIADMHCDTISRLLEVQRNGSRETLRNNRGHLDLEAMRRGNYAVQNFALFTNLKKVTDPLEYCMGLLSLFYQEMEANRDLIRPVTTEREIRKNLAAGRMSALLTIEEGGVCLGEMKNLRMFYEQGVRMMSLTWNLENDLAWPNGRDPDTGRPVPETVRGLKERGVEFAREMERMGMIIDVSHLGDEGIRQVLAKTKGPLAASHSNARAVASHPRNLPDDLIREIAGRGGVIGINFYSEFLRDVPPGEEPMGRVAHMIDHIRHIKQVGGIGCIGLGSDFDGFSDPTEIARADQMNLLVRAMEQAGFTEAETEAVCYKNVLRLYREVLG